MKLHPLLNEFRNPAIHSPMEDTKRSNHALQRTPLGGPRKAFVFHMNWLKSRFTAVVDNFLWFVLVVLMGLIVAFYRKDPQVTLLWALLVLGVINAVVLSLVYSGVRASRVPRVHMKHRNTTAEVYDEAFTTGSEVFIVSIMSQHTLREIEARLKKAQATRTRVNVLTLDPDIDFRIVDAIRLHLNEPPNTTDATAHQIKEASEQWSALTQKYPELKVRKYRSLPTLQGVLVRNGYAAIELIPFNTQTGDRPGLFLTQKDNAKLFDLFQEKFVELWESAQG